MAASRIRSAAAVAAAVIAFAAVAACSATTGGTGTASSPITSADGFPPQTATVTATPSTSVSSSAPVPTEAERDAQLTAQTNGEAHVIVAVPGGYQAATYDQSGNIQFWGNPEANLIWTQLGQSSYPFLQDLGAPDVTLIGTDLTGMKDATYIAHGVFTGDGSGDWLSFTNGRAGWGVIKAQPDGNIGPSGQPVNPADQIGLSLRLAFVNGDLQTSDCAANTPIYLCGVHPVVKLWRWAGTEFVRA